MNLAWLTQQPCPHCGQALASADALLFRAASCWTKPVPGLLQSVRALVCLQCRHTSALTFAVACRSRALRVGHQQRGDGMVPELSHRACTNATPRPGRASWLAFSLPKRLTSLKSSCQTFWAQTQTRFKVLGVKDSAAIMKCHALSESDTVQ